MNKTLMFALNKTTCCTDVINDFTVRLSEVQGDGRKTANDTDNHFDGTYELRQQ